jgi:hypothetical protein
VPSIQSPRTVRWPEARVEAEDVPVAGLDQLEVAGALGPDEVAARIASHATSIQRLEALLPACLSMSNFS